MAFDKKEYDKTYQAETYIKVGVKILREDVDKLKATAEEYEMSVSELILNALNRTYGLNLKRKRDTT